MLSGCYVLEQGAGQAELLLARRPLADVMADPAVPRDVRRKLAFLDHVRDFGVAEIGLDGNDLYRSYVHTGGAVAWNVSASDKAAFRARTWWFPVVGTVPYLGFFEKADARALAEDLRKEGWDVNLRGVGGYSTLGWFDDPVFTSYLNGDAFGIARLVLHETAHATVFFTGHVTWNETFASLVGERGALQYMAKRHGENSAQVAAARRRIAEEERFEVHMKGIVKQLEALYDSPIPRAEKLARREQLFAEGKASLKGLLADFEVARRSYWLEREWNNAVLNTFRRYRGDLAGMRKILDEQYGGNLRAYIAHLKTLDAPPGD